jgi:hypothetical protein
MTYLPALLAYLRRHDISRLDATTIGHLRTWIAEGLAQLELEHLATAGVDPEMDAEIAGQAEELRAADALIVRIQAGSDKSTLG